MARRKKRKDDWLGNLVVFIMIVIFLGVFQLTKSFAAAGIATGIYLVLAYMGLLIWRKKQEERLRQSGIHDIDKMDGRQFEFYLEQLFKSHGYTVDVTRASGDYGADLLLKKDDRKIAVQAKRHSKDVGIKAVQEVVSAKDYYECSEAWVIANRDYTEAAVNLAKKTNVKLLGRNDLIEMALKMNPSVAPNPKQILKEVPQNQISCDRCGKPMVRRTGAKGEFYGCTGYPKCRNTKAIS